MTYTQGQKPARIIPSRVYRVSTPPPLAQFKDLCSKSITQADYPLSESVSKNIPVYDVAKYDLSDSTTVSSLQDEWNELLLGGPGVYVLKNVITDMDLIERVNGVYASIIAEEAGSPAKGDHFAAAGKNSRIWNSFQKHAMKDPESFIEYYSNPWLALAYESWLGRGYQVTAQVNIVKPGGSPQSAHRDYHLGFQTADECVSFPKAMQIASQLLTLQGAVAHSEMPLNSGATRFLPFSQRFDEGYMAWRLPEFKEYFNESWVSLPLSPGDAVFFNPALFHAAGENLSQKDRSANLLQISSAFGKAMESIDNVKIIEKCFTVLKGMAGIKGKERQVDAAVKAIASGYPFPTNLDRRPPAPGGMAPSSEAGVVVEGLKNGSTTETVVAAVRQLNYDALS